MKNMKDKNMKVRNLRLKGDRLNPTVFIIIFLGGCKRHSPFLA